MTDQTTNPTDQHLRLISLKAENVKRLRAVAIKLPPHVTTITGRNAQGKSSVLDAVAMLFGGADFSPERPIRDGETKATINGDLGPLRITRTITEKGSRLEVFAADGAKYPSPQSVLDALLGHKRLAFDPEEFAREKPDVQRKMLADLVGLDEPLRALSAKRDATYNQRREVRKVLDDMEHTAKRIPPVPPGTPDQEVASADIAAELDAARAMERNNSDLRRTADNAVRVAEAARGELDIERGKLERMRVLVMEQEGKVKAAQECCEVATRNAEKLAASASALSDPDIAAITTRLGELSNVNAAVANKRKAVAVQQQIEAWRSSLQGIEDELARIERQKSMLLNDAKWPVPGLGLGEDGVLYNGRPFEQASSSERLRVALGIVMGLDDRLRVCLVRNGSLLDRESLAIIAEAAEQHDYQVLIEMVDESGQVGIVIEDGAVLAVNEPAR